MKAKYKLLIALLLLSTQWQRAGGQRIMTLEECVAAARTGNIMAKDAHNDILMAKEQQKLARTKFFPMMNASAFHYESNKALLNYSFLEQEDIDELNKELEWGFTVEDFSISQLKKGTIAGISLIEPLYTGGRITNYNKLADLQVDARNLMKDVTDDQIVMSTEFLYYKILELHETDKTLDAMERELKNIHQDAVNIWENGIAHKNDVLSVELALDQLSALLKPAFLAR